MTTEAEEEQQAQEFLKRAEIRTMRKDLLALREVDSLKERNKIATIKTLEEQQVEFKKQQEAQKLAQANAQKSGVEQVLLKNEKEETLAEKDLKNDATEQERQQIFLLESQRIGFEKQADEIDKKKDPALKLEKNQILLQTAEWQKKLSAIVCEEKKLEDEQKVIIEKEQTTTVPTERKGLEQRRSELDKEIQEMEEKRWAVEKTIQDLETKIKNIDITSQQLVVLRNELKDKILGVDKSLREIYSVIIARIEEIRRGESAEQKARRDLLEKTRTSQNEKVQRTQWTGKNNEETLKERLAKGAQSEAEERKKFLQDIEVGTNKNVGQPMQKSNTNIK